MKIKTSELTGAALDWAVAKCDGLKITYDSIAYWTDKPIGPQWKAAGKRCGYSPSTDWSQGGPIIESERIQVFPHNGAIEWCGVAHVQREGYIELLTQDGPTPLIAAMRCFVASKLGDEVDIPKKLV